MPTKAIKAAIFDEMTGLFAFCSAHKNATKQW